MHYIVIEKQLAQEMQKEIDRLAKEGWKLFSFTVVPYGMILNYVAVMSSKSRKS